jgi:hypothetical protein
MPADSRDAYATLKALGAVALIAPPPGAKHRAAEAARERMRTLAGRDAAVDRPAHAEGASAELKHDGADRARCLGTRLRQLQLLTAATAINLKRLLKADTATAAEQTGEPAVDTAAITPLLRLLARVLGEIDNLTAADSSTGSWRPGGADARLGGEGSPTPRSMCDCSSVPRPPHAA